MPKWTQADHLHMQRAFELARRGEGFVEPNPMVGCVLVKADRVVGEGYHRKFGKPHAEANALRAAGAKAKGATCYVTLEPCSHFGKTPPCADALIEAGIKRVVVAVRDPNPLVAGRGIKKLRAAGVQVELGLLKKDAERLIAPFRTFHLDKRPFITLKWAQSIDGKIATRTGDSKWITLRAARQQAHRLRARVDAILVGSGTVLADDPELTARLAKPKRIATRVVLDSQLRTPPTSKLVMSASACPVLIATTDAATVRKRRLLERAGCEVHVLPSRRGKISLPPFLALLHERGCTNLMVEGGSEVLGAFWDAGLVDRAEIYVAPRLVGGKRSLSALGGQGVAKIADVRPIRRSEVQWCGPDLWYTLEF